jgi:hypothetical protein
MLVRKEAIKDLYRSILNREADDSGLNHYLRSADSIDNIQNILLNSEEYKNKPKKLNKILAKEYLQEVVKEFDKFNIPFWLDYGTLLGYYRDNDFINHDYDIDLGVEFINFNPTIIKNFIDLRYIVTMRGYPSDSLVIKLRKNNIMFDIICYYKQPNDTITAVTMDFYDTYMSKVDIIFEQFNLIKVDFLGINVGVPDNVKHYLEQHYGNDFITPSLTWNPKNMIPTNEIIDRKKEFADINKWLDLEFKSTRDGHLLRVEVGNVL